LKNISSSPFCYKINEVQFKDSYEVLEFFSEPYSY
jgi:hypothetical protein